MKRITQLMIGNYVLYENQIHKVVGLTSKNVYISDKKSPVSVNELEPIYIKDVINQLNFYNKKKVTTELDNKKYVKYYYNVGMVCISNIESGDYKGYYTVSSENYYDSNLNEKVMIYDFHELQNVINIIGGDYEYEQLDLFANNVKECIDEEIVEMLKEQAKEDDRINKNKKRN